MQQTRAVWRHAGCMLAESLVEVSILLSVGNVKYLNNQNIKIYANDKNTKLYREQRRFV